MSLLYYSCWISGSMKLIVYMKQKLVATFHLLYSKIRLLSSDTVPASYKSPFLLQNVTCIEPEEYCTANISEVLDIIQSLQG